MLTLQSDWKKWCRLCGKENGFDVDITLKFESVESLAEAVIKYFRITIPEIRGCAKICIMCHTTISSIIKYNAHVVKINEMFLELGSHHLKQNIDAKFIREKYGINNGYDDYISSIPNNTEIYPSKIIDLIPKCEEGKSASSPENFEKLDFINADELYLTEDSSISMKGLKNQLNRVNKDELYLPEESSIPVEGLKDELSNKYNADKKTMKTFKEKTEKDNINPKKFDERVISSDLKETKGRCFKCDICEKYFVTKRGRTLHLKQKHFEKLDAPSYECNTCGKLFKNIRCRNAHEITHLPNNDRKLYNCVQCKKKFTSEINMQDHIRIVHIMDRSSFICEICGAVFGRKKNLFDHRLRHSSEKKFQCSKCEKAFKCTRSLQIHSDTHSDTEYSCQICGIKLNTKRILRRHMIVHSEQKKYKCNFCSKQFKRPDAFKNHLILHTGIKPYQCSFCDLTFTNGSNCRKHQKTVHSVEVSEAERNGKQKIFQNLPSIKQLKAVNEKVLTSENKS